MPSVFTIQGAASGRRCKKVKNKKTGCTITLCHVGKSRKSPTGWKFMKGSTTCSKRGRKR